MRGKVYRENKFIQSDASGVHGRTVACQSGKTIGDIMNAIPTMDNVQPATAKSQSISQTFIFQNRLGLDCRSAALLATNLRKFGCDARVEANGAVANGKSVIGMLTLAAGYGSKLRFVLTGSDAGPAMESLSHIFGNNFA